MTKQLEKESIIKLIDPTLTDEFIEIHTFHDTNRDLQGVRVDLVYWVLDDPANEAFDLRNPFVLVSVAAPTLMISQLLRVLRFSVREKLRAQYTAAEFMFYLSSTDGETWSVVPDYKKEERFICL